MLKLKKIIVSQPAPIETVRSPYLELADKYKFSVDFRPFIKVEGVSKNEFRQSKVEILAHGAVFLTSKTAADHYFRICEEMRVNIPDTMKYFCISESVANYLQKYITYRKRKIFFAEKVDDLLTMMNRHREDKILLPLSETHKLDVPKMLEKKDFQYTKVILYRTESSKLTDIDINQYDMLVFYSPAEIKSLQENFPTYQQEETKIACFGATTVKAAKTAKLRVDIQAPKPKTPSLTMAIENYLKDKIKKV